MRHHTLHEAMLYGHGIERPFLCPVHGDSRPSASVNTVKGLWICYTCGAKGGLSGEDLLIEPDYQVMKTWFENKMEEQRVYPESWLDRFTAGGVHPYWAARVGESAAVAHKLGYDVESERLTYPLRRADGSVLGVVRRSAPGSEEDAGPKYLYPPGVDVGSLLYNYTSERRRVVVLCEGALDAIAFDRLGVTAFAIYGARLGETQRLLIDRVDPEYIFTGFDNDDAGRRAHWAVEQAFKHRQVGKLSWPLSWGKDVDEIGQEKLKKVCEPLVSVGLQCVGSTTWEADSSESSETRRPKIRTTASSMTTSQPRRPRIRRTAA